MSSINDAAGFKQLAHMASTTAPHAPRANAKPCPYSRLRKPRNRRVFPTYGVLSRDSCAKPGLEVAVPRRPAWDAPNMTSTHCREASMLSMSTRQTVSVAAVLVAFAVGAVMAQQPGPACGNHDWAPKVPEGKHHNLAATLETVQWGWLDPREKPKLVIDSGDTVSVETMMHSHDKVQPGITMEQVVELRKANPGGGPHSMTGPIYVNGAEPGDVLEIRVLRIEPKAWAVNFNLPGKDFPTIGALAPEMPEGHIKFFPLDLQKRSAEFKSGIVLDLQPFPGTFAVGIDPDDPSPRKGGVKDDPMAPVSTLRPWKNGSNMDINELQEGTTLFVPVFLKGGLIW